MDLLIRYIDYQNAIKCGWTSSALDVTQDGDTGILFQIIHYHLILKKELELPKKTLKNVVAHLPDHFGRNGVSFTIDSAL